METKRCKYCGTIIDKKAKHCYNCKRRQDNMIKIITILGISILLIIIFILIIK